MIVIKKSLIKVLVRNFRNYKNNLISIIKDNPFTFILVIGLVIRAFFVLRADFPLNDGGFFYKMTQELVENNFEIPLYTSYNHANIPFAYPPLGFYVAGFLSSFLNINLIEVFRFLPLVVSVLTIPAFYLMAKELFSQKFAIISSFIFTVLPRSFMWMIMGGGVARSFGFLFSILSLFFGVKYFNLYKKKVSIFKCFVFNFNITFSFRVVLFCYL